MTIRISKNRAYAECPNCHELHLVRKEARHLTKATKQGVRFRCVSCKCTWVPSAADVEQVTKFYGFKPDEAKNEKRNKDQGGQSIGSLIFGRKQ